MPERIAAELGIEIARGNLADGERLREVAIAATYGVSRAPAREAIRLLAKRGLVNFTPRHGAFVRALTINKVIDLCITRSVLQGLAARYFAALATPAALGDFRIGLDGLEGLAEDPTCDPLEFSFASTRLVSILDRHCGSESLAELIAHQVDSSVWSTLWRLGHLDFATPERRQEWAAQSRLLYEALAARDPVRAERIMRAMMDEACRNAVQTLSKLRGEAYDARRLVLGGEHPPVG